MSTGNNTFGYNPRYSEYKFANNRVSGEFRTTQNFWHMGRIFDAEPSLNEAFVVSSPTDRVYAVQGSSTMDPSTDQLYAQIYHKVDALRPLPYYGTPI